ncbi:hypothetical protein B0T14DRAFT_452641 [Immersiella caudata]|uniref:RING-type domain-containing protein n=1 Tax=Immersiella caudata TaxID=314043 RepID=A0AA40C378_9PEZI|nr:hypothetical protein B0T14DRAFT_452641 [Immersiella caudata]
MSHSKRNTSRPVFTAHERSLARAAWGSSTARLSRESFLPFASCGLCLEPAIDPVSCVHGDIFCRECALSNILAQKKEIKRFEKAREQEEREALEEQARRNMEAQERTVREFELTQAGLAIKAGAQAARGKAEASTGLLLPDKSSGQRVEKRKREDEQFRLEQGDLERISEQRLSKARREMEDEKASKPTLPSFWSPSVTPSSNKKDTLHEVKKKVKSQPICPVSPEHQPHLYSLHALITVNFTEETDAATKTKQRVCPACKKVLTNSSRATLAKPCGHVLCKSCVDKFMQPSEQRDPHSPDSEIGAIICYVCDASLAEKPEKKGKGEKEKIKPGLVELRREGTGFSAGGANQVKRELVNFQC